ncbi:MAG: hypothetical protein HY965_04255 [Ignavibacteriales bacterium]|nr:hypothetical protein [Ignavibacteriales bacterium]
MKHLMFLAVLVFWSFPSHLLSQNFTSTTSYQVGRKAEFYGTSFSTWIKTWNNQKVITRATIGYLRGTDWSDGVKSSSTDRFEFGIDSRNTMILGKDYFHVFGFSYTTTTHIQGNNPREDGWMFSFGFGAHVIEPFSFTARYVLGNRKGIRLGIECDF